MIRKLFASAIGAIILSFGFATPSTSRVFEDVWGVVTDPLKLGQSSAQLAASVERVMLQLQALQAKADYDVKQRLEQVRSILKETIAEASERMLAVEKEINADAVRLIYRAQCATDVVLLDRLQRSFAQLISNLNKANPGIRILGVTIIDVSANEVKIDNPDQAYASTKAAVMSRLEQTMSDESNAYDILSAYQNLAMAASFTRCHYIDLALAVRLTEEVNEFDRLLSSMGFSGQASNLGVFFMGLKINLLMASVMSAGFATTIIQSNAIAQATCKTTLECAQKAVDAAARAEAAVSALEKRMDSRLLGLGGGRILGIIEVKGGNVVYASTGVSFDQGSGTITLPNPGNLRFIPIVSDAKDLHYITSTNFIRSIQAPNKFVIWSKALDTGDRNGPPVEFTAIAIGFGSSP